MSNNLTTYTGIILV